MSTETAAAPGTIDFLSAPGEMSAIIRGYDWERTSLGPVSGWPLSLRSTIGIILHSAFPHFFFWGPDLICFYNDAFRPSLGHNGKHPSIGKKGREVWPEIWEFIGPLIRQVMDTGVPVKFEDQLVPFFRNGRMEDIYWTFCYSAAFGDDGKVAGVFVTCTETTEKVTTLKNLSESENRFKTLVNEATVGIVVLVGDNLEVNIVNEAYGRLIGRTAEQLSGKPLFSVLPEAEQEFRPIVERVRTSGVSFSQHGQPYRVNNGEEQIEGYLNIVYQPYRNSGSEEQGVMILCQDVTDLVVARQRIEETVVERTRDLLEANSNLERSNAELAQFAYIASHDLQEPLRKINTFSQMLADPDLPPDKVRTFLEKIRSSTARMTALVRDVLNYSSLARPGMEVVAVDLNTELRTVLEDLEYRIEQKRATVTVHPLPSIKGVPLQLRQLFTNLVSNALKFSKAGVSPEITISSSPPLEKELEEVPGRDSSAVYCRIVVKDNGIGIDEKFSEKIFNIFQRLNAREEYEGTGIGLAICKKVCLNHHGHIRVESAKGVGSEFIMLLPLAHGHEAVTSGYAGTDRSESATG